MIYLICNLLINQVEVVPPGIWDKLFDQVPIVILLGLAVWWLLKRDIKRDEKLESYIAEDRKEMLTTIQNNTTAMNEMTKVMSEKSEIDRELNRLIERTLLK